MVMAGSAANAGVARMRRDKSFFIDLSCIFQMKRMHLKNKQKGNNLSRCFIVDADPTAESGEFLLADQE